MSSTTTSLMSTTIASSTETIVATVTSALETLHTTSFANNSVAFIPHNFSTNATVPWEEPEKMGLLFQQWVKFENLPGWRVIMVGVMTLLFHATTMVLRYPLWRVMSTIATVEAPSTTLRADISPSTSKKYDDEKEGTTAIVSQVYSWSSGLRAAVSHIYRIAGLSSFYRGLAVTVCIHIVGDGLLLLLVVGPVTMTGQWTGDPKRRFEKGYVAWPVEFTTWFLCHMLICQWYTARTHIIITQPTLRIWYRRLPPFTKTFKATWLAELIRRAAWAVTFELPYQLCYLAGLYKKDSYLGTTAAGNAWYLRNLVFAIIWLAAQLARIELLIPAGVAITRIQASLLPDDEETIIPLDRKFSSSLTERAGGYKPLAPGILAPSRGAIGFVAAWKSYDRADRKRLLILYAKFVVVEAVLTGGFWCVLGNTVWPQFWHPQL